MILTINSKIIMPKPNTWADLDLGPRFRTAVIGNQEWMAENLAIDDGLGGIWIEDKGEAYGFNYGTQYFYNWSAAYRIAQAFGDGWRLPTVNDFNTLQSTVASIIGTSNTANSMKATSGWQTNNGTDQFGLSINAAGYPDKSSSVGSYVNLWTSEPYADKYYRYSLYTFSSKFAQDTAYNGQYASVRLVRDVT